MKRPARLRATRETLDGLVGYVEAFGWQLESGELHLPLEDDADLERLERLSAAASTAARLVEAALRERREAEIHATRRTSPRPLRWSRFAAVPPRAAGDPQLRPTDLRVLIAVAAFADRTGTCRAAQATLAQAVGVHRTTILRALKRLEELGYVTRERFLKRGPDGGAIRGTDMIKLVYEAAAVAPMDATAGMATDDDNAEAMRHVPAVAGSASAAVAESASAAVAPMDATAVSPPVGLTYRKLTTPEGARVRARKRVTTTSDIAHESDIATVASGEDVVQLVHGAAAVPDSPTRGGWR
jgi:DNA-binding Lrp family transcriptional regulator